MNIIRSVISSFSSKTFNQPQILSNPRKILDFQPARYFDLYTLHRRMKRPRLPKPSKNKLGEGVPMCKGIVLKTLIKKPKKPNSANRKCVLVRLSNGKEMTAFVPGEGHNLQEHSTVMVRCGRTKDVPRLKIKCIRGVYDLGHVVKKVV